MQRLHGPRATGNFDCHQTTREKRLTTEPPNITEDVFEDALATDDLLVDYFNEFLCLPAFSEPIRFNRIFGIFEVNNDAPERLKQQMKKTLRDQKPPNPIYDVTRHATSIATTKKKCSSDDLNIDNNYTVMCLNREQGVQWIKKERLQFFLKSDCYFEYRLAKLMSQVKLSNAGAALLVDSRYQPWDIRKELPPPAREEDENEMLMKKFYVTLGEASFTQTKEWFTLAKQSQQTSTTDSFSRPLAWSEIPASSSLKLGQHALPNGSTSSSGVGYVKKLSSLLANGSPSTCLAKSAERDEVVHKSSDSPQSDGQEYSVSISSSPSPSPFRIYVETKCENGTDGRQTSQSQTANEDQNMPSFETLEDFAVFYIDRVIADAVSRLTGQPPVERHDGVNIYTLSEVIIHNLPSCSPSTLSSKSSEIDVEEDDMSSESEIEEAQPGASCAIVHKNYNIRSRKAFERFKSFLKGTLGENHWLLWLDIERLKALKDSQRQISHLNRMKMLYLVTNGDHFLKMEILTKLNLLAASQWNTYYLPSIQIEVAKPLLLYWGPRFCVAPTASAQGVTAQLNLWQDRQLRPKRDIDPFPKTMTLLPLRAKSCLPRISISPSQSLDSTQPKHSTKKDGVEVSAKTSKRLISANLEGIKSTLKRALTSNTYTSGSNVVGSRPASSYMSHNTGLTNRSQSLEPQPEGQETRSDLLSCKCTMDRAVPGGSALENMLQALHLDSRAGYYFTQFCEMSGNELWKRSAYFWFDLQTYHHLFYQETLNPFKLSRQAQCLFATYIAPAAAMDIGLEQCVKREIYHKLNPPFEDLFDLAEEYVLTLLLIPWIQMTESDRSTFGKVELVEETRQLDSVCFRKLQALQQENASKKDEGAAPATIFLPPPDNIKEPNLWEQVPEEYRNYNLSFLVHHRLELEHFRAFLDDNFASMDLMCWIDIEQFRRMSYKEKEKREEKSKDIKSKYLNKKYFFGPNSPATRDQQEQVMQLGGGWGKILQDRLASAVLLEIQKYVRMRIERKWLPLFLATDEYRERQKVQAQMKDVAEDVIFQTSRKRLGVWKHLDSKWISSSKEIIEFRKALLNPITVSQFQRFIALKSDFFENGLLFWLEVQKYKDLCHSHCDDATIQNKITAIINCFINSNIPPALQIDIPPEQAEKILEHRRDLGPYVFREAQMTIFSIMFKFWHEFCEFRSNLSDEKILPALERKRDKKIDRLKRKLKEEERLAKKQEEEAKRRTSLSDISDIYGDNESSYSGGMFAPKQVSWSYSKYIEALEQERMLLKVQEDLERKTSSSLSSDSASMYSVKTEATRRTGRSLNSSGQCANIEKTFRSPQR